MRSFTEMKEEIFDLERRRKRGEHVIKDLDMRKIEGGVFEHTTLNSLGKLAMKGVVDRLVSPIATGKEADVFLGERNGGKVAVKIFRLASASYFRKPTIMEYVIGDERFRKVKRDSRSIQMAWVQKEFRNLMIAQEARVSAPRPLGVEKNILVMDYIGREQAAPQIKDLDVDAEMLEDIVENLRKLVKARLIHADISEYNILMGESPVIIDFAQGVLNTHPKAEEFLARDLKNLCSFFSKRGIECELDEIAKRVGN
jgi:RIO kinase 1